MTMTSTQPKHASYMYRKSRKQPGTTNRAYPYNQELHLQATKNKPKLTLPPTAIALGRHNQNMLVICIEKAASSQGPLTEPTPTTKNFTFKPRKTSLNLRCLQLRSLWGDDTTPAPPNAPLSSPVAALSPATPTKDDNPAPLGVTRSAWLSGRSGWVGVWGLGADAATMVWRRRLMVSSTSTYVCTESDSSCSKRLLVWWMLSLECKRVISTQCNNEATTKYRSCEFAHSNRQHETDWLRCRQGEKKKNSGGVWMCVSVRACVRVHVCAHKYEHLCISMCWNLGRYVQGKTQAWMLVYECLQLPACMHMRVLDQKHS